MFEWITSTEAWKVGGGSEFTVKFKGEGGVGLRSVFSENLEFFRSESYFRKNHLFRLFKITHVTQGCFAMLVSGIFNNQSGNHPVADERGTSWGGKDRKEKLQKRKKERLFFPKLTGILDKFSSWSCLYQCWEGIRQKEPQAKKAPSRTQSQKPFPKRKAERKRHREREEKITLYIII